WQALSSGVDVRPRGGSPGDGRVVWARGGKGTVLPTTDARATWARPPGPGAGGLDLRGGGGFSAESAGGPPVRPGGKSRIYRTTDGGATWTLSFTNPDAKGFYDALAFWDEAHGLAAGDPVDGRFQIVRTTDAGASWARVDAAMPPALEGEGAFAASGT